MRTIDWETIRANIQALYPQLNFDTASKSGATEPDLPACATCHDAGYLRYDVPHNHPSFGKLLACPICGPKRQEEYIARLAERISAECGLDLKQRGVTFESFARYPGNERALDAARDFAGAGLDRGAWLVIQASETGVGKTHLLAAIANAAIARGVPTVYSYTTDLLDHLRAGYRKKADEESELGDFDERWERLKRIRLLLLDDFGVQVNTAWATERMEALIDARYRAGLPLAITTNLADGDWLKLSARIRDRFDRYVPADVVQMRAVKYRTWKRQAAGTSGKPEVTFQ